MKASPELLLVLRVNHLKHTLVHDIRLKEAREKHERERQLAIIIIICHKVKNHTSFRIPL